MAVTVRQVTQPNDYYCGPAVTEMLLSAVGVEVDQRIIAEATGLREEEMDKYGVRIDQLARAVSQVAPDYQFWYKYRAEINDLIVIIGRGYPVGVEWQGLFYESEEEEYEAEGIDYRDRGHYSVAVHVDEDYGEIVFVDPYKQFAGRKRLFSLAGFKRRWWDINYWQDELTGERKTRRDERLIFMITPAGEVFPADLGCKSFMTAERGGG